MPRKKRKEFAKARKRPKTKRYEVEVSRTVMERHTQYATVEVEANSPDEAEEKAAEIASKDFEGDETSGEAGLRWQELDCPEMELEDLDAYDATPLEDD
jgi:hypothetical protein